MHSSNTLRIPLLRRVFQYSRSLSWKKELHMFNWKDIRQISKSQKVKSQKVYFSTFQLFDFSIFRNSKRSLFTFRLFHFSKLKPFLHNPLNNDEETNLNYYSETVEIYTRFWNDISQLILWICLHKAHRYDLRPVIPAKSSLQTWRNQFELLLGNGWVLHKVLKWHFLTFPDSFYEFSFTRAIDMNLDPPFLYNPLNKNEETNLDYSETVEFYTQNSEMISPNSFCGFIFTRAIDMDLDPPILQNPWTKMEKTIWFINRKVLGARSSF